MLVEGCTFGTFWYIRRRREKQEEWKEGYARVDQGEAFVVGEDEAQDESREMALR